ncbi:MAG TPA: hypothetical protein PLR51_01270 [Methanomassiliicoccales archaeon]|nr:hypothetical protein [Methanomassiliicoccales archaeon]HQQ24890.1 hypothetical protein [Methanomassiliicoccales archaeon]
MRITPAKWDAEYVWLRSGKGVVAWQAEPKIKVRGGAGGARAWRFDRFTATGLAMQTMAAVMLGLLAMDGHLLTLLPLMALIGGEVIFISSLDHKVERSAGDH